MPSLKDLRNRIASVKATQKITKAMQMVAAAKLRRSQSAAESARPFAERMNKVLSNLANGLNVGASSPKLLAGSGSDKTHLLLVCTGERGLCGAFNSSIVRLAREHVQRLTAQGKVVKIFCVGRKGYDQLKRNYENLIIDYVDLRSVRSLRFENAEAIGKNIVSRFQAGEFDICTLFFAHFHSVIAQVPTAEQLIPAQITAEKSADASISYEIEPCEEEILTTLLPQNVNVQIFKALLENMASFYGAQMSAMDSATRNAGDMIRKQTTIYNRSRQAMITKELIEIISGAEAL